MVSQGHGEQLMQWNLAGSVTAAVRHGSDPATRSIEDVVQGQLREFVAASATPTVEKRHAGCLTLCVHSADPLLVDMAAGHSTRHFAYAYVSSKMAAPRSFVSTLFDDEKRDGRSVSISGVSLRL
jgi:hypothetical protein